MILKQLYVKNFGKLNECVITLQDGLNLITGSNESGKSTLYTFIKSMLYGIRRMRGRAAQSDTYSRYEPWGNPSYYAGVLHFESGGKLFRLSRNFHKSNPKAELICETDGEKLSVEHGDLKMLLGNVSESVFENTLSIGQLKSITDENLLTALRNYMVNYQTGNSGDMNVELAISQLKKTKKELENQIKEEQQELQIKLREKRIQYSYLEKERMGIQERIEAAREFLPGNGEKNHDRRRLNVYLIFGIALIALITAVVLFKESLIPALLALFLGAGSLLYVKSKLSKEKQDRIALEERVSRERWNCEQLEEMFQEKTQELHNLYQELLEMQEKLNEPNVLQEDIAAVNLAINTIDDLSKKKGNIGVLLQKRASQILYELTDGKYIGIHLSEDLKINIDTKEAYVSPEQLSRGTMEQIYFAFRMAAEEVLCQEEKLPVILDDVFVMYDEKRLAKTLQWLSGCGHQVLLFSCHTREAAIMDQLKIPYHKICMEDLRC